MVCNGTHAGWLSGSSCNLHGRSAARVCCCQSGLGSTCGAQLQFDLRPQRQGGAVAVWDKAEALLVGCTLLGNSASSGGALSVSTSEEALDINAVRSQVWVYDSLFDGNALTSGLGGGRGTAVIATRALLFLANCTFRAHSSSGFGTVAGLGSPGLAGAQLSLLNVTFDGNAAQEVRRQPLQPVSTLWESVKDNIEVYESFLFGMRSITYQTIKLCIQD